MKRRSQRRRKLKKKWWTWPTNFRVITIFVIRDKLFNCENTRNRFGRNYCTQISIRWHKFGARSACVWKKKGQLVHSCVFTVFLTFLPIRSNYYNKFFISISPEYTLTLILVKSVRGNSTSSSSPSSSSSVAHRILCDFLQTQLSAVQTIFLFFFCFLLLSRVCEHLCISMWIWLIVRRHQSPTINRHHQHHPIQQTMSKWKDFYSNGRII